MNNMDEDIVIIDTEKKLLHYEKYELLEIPYGFYTGDFEVVDGKPILTGDNVTWLSKNHELKYHGRIVNNWCEGYGRMIYSNGDEYIGNWIKGSRNGHGVTKYSNGDEYIGNWVKSSRNGHGVMKYKDGDEYTGEWLNDKKNGKGCMKYKDGIFNGEFVEDHIQNGQMKYSDGDEYTGGWNNGLFHGFGTIIFGKPHPMYGKSMSGKYVMGKAEGLFLIERDKEYWIIFKNNWPIDIKSF